MRHIKNDDVRYSSQSGQYSPNKQFFAVPYTPPSAVIQSKQQCQPSHMVTSQLSQNCQQPQASAASLGSTAQQENGSTLKGLWEWISYLKNVMEDMQREIKQLKSDKDILQRRIDELVKVISALQCRDSQGYERPAQSIDVTNRNAHASIRPSYEFEVNYKIEGDFNYYVKAYKDLQNSSRFKQAQQINDFCHKWHIEKFKCANEYEKRGNPNIEPIFASSNEGYFWASPLDTAGYYMVLPVVNVNYEAIRHNEKGYKEAFSSNYSHGAYSFVPQKPAVFRKDNNIWTIVRKGELRLNSI